MKQRILLKSVAVIFILMVGMLVYAYLRVQEVKVPNDSTPTSNTAVLNDAAFGLSTSKSIS